MRKIRILNFKKRYKREDGLKNLNFLMLVFGLWFGLPDLLSIAALILM